MIDGETLGIGRCNASRLLLQFRKRRRSPGELGGHRLAEVLRRQPGRVHHRHKLQTLPHAVVPRVQHRLLRPLRGERGLGGERPL